MKRKLYIAFWWVTATFTGIDLFMINFCAAHPNTIGLVKTFIFLAITKAASLVWMGNRIRDLR